MAELTLIITIITLIFLGLFARETKTISRYLILTGLTTALFLTLFTDNTLHSMAFQGLLVFDPFSYFFKTILIASSLFVTAVFVNKDSNPVFNTMFLSAVLCGTVAASSVNIAMTFISLILMSLLIIMIASKDNKTAISHYIYFSVSSGLLLYGFSLLYGITGSLDYYETSKFLLITQPNDLVLTISLILIVSGLGFILKLFPFNIIYPAETEKNDYTNISITTFAPMITGTAVILRLFLTILYDSNAFTSNLENFGTLYNVKFGLLLALISGASIISGNAGILRQTGLGKIFTFSVIAQSGYLLTGLVSSSPEGTSAELFNIVIFLFNAAGLLFSIKIINEKFNAENIKDITGLGRNNKFIFIIFLFFLISFAGFPLTPGFSGRLLAYSSLHNSGFDWLIIVGIISSILYVYFIFNLAYAIFSKGNNEKTAKIETNYNIILLILLIPAILTGIYPAPLLQWVKFCSNILRI